MEKILKSKRFFTFTKCLACFTGILLVMLAVFSCTNMLIRDGGSLIIALPGARAASDSISYTIVVEGSQGSTQSKPLTGGTTVQFDDLAPDTYSISVEGRNEDDAVVLYGTDSATVEAGKTASADVELKKGASDFASLESAIAAGGTVYIFESIDVESGLTVGTTVKILPAYQNVTLTNKSSENLFTVDTNGNLTIGGGEYTITLNGNADSHHAIYMKNTGKATLNANAVIMNCGTSSVKLYNPNSGSSAIFYLEGGSIRDNKGSGVDAGYYSKFYMNSGIIERNESTSSGGGVNLTDSTAALYMEGGSITGNKAKSGQGGGVYVGRGSLHMNGGYITENESSGGGGGIYSDGSIAMTGGYIGGNSSLSNSGNGVFYNSGTFEMSGSTVIAPDNDVYLNKTRIITITGNLTGDSPVATITLYDGGYTAGTAILTNGVGDALDFATESGKFAVTPKPDDGTQWFINTEGKLQEGVCVSDFASLENAISAGGTVYISKAITMERTLDINKAVTLLSTTQSVVLTGLNPGNLFTVSTGGDFTIGDETIPSPWMVIRNQAKLSLLQLVVLFL